MNSEEYAKFKLPCEEIGRALSCDSDVAQATVLNTLAAELKLVCRDKELTGMQVCYMARSLNKSGRLLVKRLAEYVELAEDEEKS